MDSSRQGRQGLHFFCAGEVDGGKDDAAVLGHKGAHLAEMMKIGLPVPPGFVLDVHWCAAVRDHEDLDAERRAQVGSGLACLERECAAGFGDPERPLLLAVRAATRRSQPGLLPAITNIGLSPVLIAQAIAHGHDATFLWDCYRRFLHVFGVHVAHLPHELFEDVLEDFREAEGLADDHALTAAHWREVAGRYEALIREQGGREVPQDPQAQLFLSLHAAIDAWEAPNVRAARRLYHIPDEWGVAVCVQAMVFGNRNDRSAAGVAITRDPTTGEKIIGGEYLPRVQGEDIVSGLRTPWPITEHERRKSGLDVPSLETAMPAAFASLLKVVARLERHYRRAQNIEFIIDDGKLWLVQTFPARLGPAASLRVAVDMVREGILSREEALCRVDPDQLEKLLHPVLERAGGQMLLARGLGASPGAASGEVVIDAEEAMHLAAAGRPVILVRTETTPEDIPALKVVRGVVTARGGLTSHAAVIARGFGIPCVAGVGLMEIDAAAGMVRMGDHEVRVGEWITLDGTSGEVFRGRLPTRQPELSKEFHLLLRWADAVRKLEVRANADTPQDAEMALKFGAEGIGLCRTEHMIFGTERLLPLQELLLTTDAEQRKLALTELARTHGEDFVQLFAVMAGKPVTVRLLDPPAHEFLPRTQAETEMLAERLQLPPERVRARVDSLREYNPMLGHRGIRLALTVPGLVRMQVRAMLEAMLRLRAQERAPARLEIMAPFIMNAAEMRWLHGEVQAVAAELREQHDGLPAFSLGCMIEIPAACLRADAIAAEAAFFSFGTNDLTQTVLGLSRDDAGRFIHVYLEQGLLAVDPFATLEETAVVPAIRMAVERGRSTRPDLQVGACGEHAGDPRSIRLLAHCGLDYVSCSPFRIPIARLAAAQAALATREKVEGAP